MQRGYALNRSLLSSLITHQMPETLWKMELLRTSMSECLQALLLAVPTSATLVGDLCSLFSVFLFGMDVVVVALFAMEQRDIPVP